MTEKIGPDKDRLAAALGASFHYPVATDVTGSPLSLLALGAELHGRLQSRGGRPTDPEWTMTRQVPLKEHNWKALQRLSDEIDGPRKVGAAQLAAVLIEKGLLDIESDRWTEVLHASRSTDPRLGADAAEVAGISYRQLDAWCRQGAILAEHSEGRRRWFSDDEVVRAIWLRVLGEGEQDVSTYFQAVRAMDLTKRFLFAERGGRPASIGARVDLMSQMGESGVALVLDQLPVRLRLIGWTKEADVSESTPKRSSAAS